MRDFRRVVGDGCRGVVDVNSGVSMRSFLGVVVCVFDFCFLWIVGGMSLEGVFGLGKYWYGICVVGDYFCVGCICFCILNFFYVVRVMCIGI